MCGLTALPVLALSHRDIWRDWKGLEGGRVVETEHGAKLARHSIRALVSMETARVGAVIGSFIFLLVARYAGTVRALRPRYSRVPIPSREGRGHGSGGNGNGN